MDDDDNETLTTGNRGIPSKDLHVFPPIRSVIVFHSAVLSRVASMRVGPLRDLAPRDFDMCLEEQTAQTLHKWHHHGVHNSQKK